MDKNDTSAGSSDDDDLPVVGPRGGATNVGLGPLSPPLH